MRYESFNNTTCVPRLVPRESLVSYFINYVEYIMVVRNVTNNLFDVFWKDGWDNCVRVKRIGKDFRVVKAFKKPPRDVFQFIKRNCL